MTEIPRHLLKRAQAAREKAAAEEPEARDFSGEPIDPADVVRIAMKALGREVPEQTQIVEPENMYLQSHHADWIELTAFPNRVFINTHQITHVEEEDGGCFVRVASGPGVSVQQDYHTVKKLILGE